MTTEINVISRTQIILVDPTSGSVSVINAGPQGPAGPGGDGGGGTTLPPGVMMPFAGAGAIPAGWLLCDGTVYNNTQYPALAAVLGTTYGGNGTSNFGVPNLKGKTIFGVDPSNPLFSTMGGSGGSFIHSHNLDDNGYACLSLAAVSSTDSMKTRSVNTPNWTAGFGNKTVLGWGGPASTTANRGTALRGKTADATAPPPPFIAMKYIIKT